MLTGSNKFIHILKKNQEGSETSFCTQVFQKGTFCTMISWHYSTQLGKTMF